MGDYENVGRWSLWLLSLGFIYFILVIVADSLDLVKILSKLMTQDVPVENEGLDEDVLREQERLRQGSQPDVVQVQGLRKIYGWKVSMSKPVTAVKGIWFGVQKGEVFGFLGTNGAGKTTTLSLLTGEHLPTAGGATICGSSITTDQLKCRQHIGFCPQFDAIFDKLSAREHLRFYCMLKGITEPGAVQQQVETLIKSLGLTKYADRPSEEYSGGNKRKLSTAIALVGNPSVVILDEPSSGMDPVAKRNMWEFISKSMQNRAVILTTHSMEECTALAHRVGIMVAGNLRCLGTNQHIKNRFGKGYELNIKLEERDIEPMIQFLLQTFAEAEVLETYEGNVKIKILSGDMPLGAVFRRVEEAKNKFNASNYSLTQTTLEQIFIQFARDWEKKQHARSGQPQMATLTSGNA